LNLDRFTGLPQWPLRSHGGKGIDRIMKSLLKLKPASMILIAALAFWAPAASASLVIFGDGQWGDFTGSITYHAADASHATLQVLLHNSSPLENGGFLTGFALNNPDNLISTVTAFQSTNPNFKLLGGPGFQDGINGAPYGQFDLGASTFKSLEGGGKPSKGLAVGATETFTFTLAGSLLLSLDEWSFVQELSVGPGIGEAPSSWSPAFAALIMARATKPRVMPSPSPAPWRSWARAWRGWRFTGGGGRT
jgi:hypothetical protein